MSENIWKSAPEWANYLWRNRNHGELLCWTKTKEGGSVCSWCTVLISDHSYLPAHLIDKISCGKGTWFHPVAWELISERGES